MLMTGSTSYSVPVLRISREHACLCASYSAGYSLSLSALGCCAGCGVHGCKCRFAVAGRKKRRAARGRTDVGEQPYEDPNMRMVLHQPQDSFAQQFLQVCCAAPSCMGHHLAATPGWALIAVPT